MQLARDAPAIPTAASRAARRRESVLLASLAIAGAVIEYPLAFALKSLDRSELVRALPFLGVTIVLAALIPLSLRLSDELGLPGAPLIAAKLAGEKLHFSIRSLLRVSIGYAFLAAVAGASVLALVIVPLVLIQHGGAGLKLPNTPMMTVAPGRIAIRRSVGRDRGGSQRRNPVSICALCDPRMDRAADVARFARPSGTPRAVDCDDSAGLPVRIDSPGAAGRDAVP